MKAVQLIKISFLILLLGLTTSCSTLKLEDYAKESPKFDLKQFFNGDITGWAIFQKRGGEIAQRFRVEIKASWQGNNGVLDETFYYPDGTTSKRIWKLVDLGGGKYKRTADDVDGEAFGEIQGNAFRWKYTLKLKVDKSVYNVTFDDWMWQIDDKVVMNRSYMSKFGVDLGELSLSLHKK